ncbi:DoxX family protein [Weissella minor]|uniref:DoxX family protein n=1 Tax=Weissella minor TaxID=1620 RepID=A0A0R2JF98_9LACO|nr:DoxX family protein [Weissella minor]KRN76015.1 hypothetical protein IV67_GL001065 [Weissella minor]
MNADKLKYIGISMIKIMLGITMAWHGFAKVTDLQGTGQFFASLGLPTQMALMIGLIELIGGIMMIAGVLVPIVALLFVGVLAGAIVTVKLQSGFLNGYEYELFLLVVSAGMGLFYADDKYLQRMLAIIRK